VYLKQLDIIGFKSFPNKTSIKFSPGKTAIVGPNGCGKTNVLDAIRWVMGEQKITLLRGSKMEEVIFNGSRDMAPLGMAEVTLTMINNRGVLPTEYSEVQITRRLFRSGEAEYLLNKVPCRLRDIAELFYDTGAGAHSYSVIQQQMIDSVISDKAEDRRFLFEEAAGITKYKQRKKAALRKLEATEQDLLRLKDIYAEIKTQVNSLHRQQKKAERYKQLSDEIRQWELYFTSTRLKKIDFEKRILKDSIDKLSANIIESESGMDIRGAELERLKSKQIELDQQIAKVGQEMYDSTESAHIYETEITVLKEKRINAKSLIDRNNKEIEALRKRSETLSEQAVDTGAVLNKLKSKLDTVRGELLKAQSIQAEVDIKLLAARGTKERENSRLIELEGKISSGKTEDENLKDQLNQLNTYLGELSAKLKETRISRARFNESSDAAKSRASDLLSECSCLQADLQKIGIEIKEMKLDLEKCDKNLAASLASKEAMQGQKELLNDVVISFENSENAISTIFEIKDKWPGIIGMVSDKFVPTKGYEKALEGALGEISKYAICDSKDTAEKILKYLQSENKGRVGLVVPNTGTINPVIRRPDINLPGFVGWLDSFVSADESVIGMMHALLCHIGVFESWIDPKQILERLPYGFKAVSTDGLLYYRNTIVGGSSESLQIFSRKAQLTDLDMQIASATDLAQALATKQKLLTAEVQKNEKIQIDLVRRIQLLNGEIAANQKSIDENNYELRLLESEITRLLKEQDSVKDKAALIEQRQNSLKLDYGKLGEDKKNLMEALSLSTRRLEEIEQDAATSMTQVSRFQIGEVETQSRIEQSETKLNHTKELLNEIANSIKSKTEEITAAESEIQSGVKRTDELETKLKFTFETRSEIAAAQTELKNRHTELSQKAAELERQVKLVRSEKDRIKEEFHQNEMKLQSFDSEAKSISERIKEEYDVSLSDYSVDCPDPQLSENEAHALLLEHKDALKKFGAVNLLALEEFQTTSERKEFLEKQLADLESARNDLLATITKINKTARDLFEETFEKVKTNFQMLFTELFEGGEAGLSLENPNDPLESNIDITARPKGKKLQSITMMSGGERALTAISLLFSLYLVKPSAYCILDEIDAPLDDSNCRRFLRLISKFANNTQFIIITHNKITMQAADNLYGITMVEPGISQIVAVKFSEIETKDGEVIISVTPPIENLSEPDNQKVPEKVAERLKSNVSSTPSAAKDH
jgi:chromosome segregation protein